MTSKSFQVMGYDIVVIGGGLGGLTAGAKLASAGKKVLLIEQHDRPGGCATTFRRRDFTFEVGLHEMDGMDGRDMKTRIFNDLGIFEHCNFIPVPEFYRFFNERQDIVISHDPAQNIAMLSELFPDDKDGIEAYFDRVLNARKYLKESAGKKEESLGDYLDSIIGNEDLKLVLLGNLGYFHDDPYSLSLNYYAMAQGSYYSAGGVYIKGGSQRLSDALSAVIESNGGKVMLKHLVTGITVESGKATGVTFRKTGSEATLVDHATAAAVIANAAIPNVAEILLPEENAAALKSDIAKRIKGASLLTVYYGFNKPLKETLSRHYSTFLYDPSIRSQKDILDNNRGPFDRRSFTFVDYSQVEAGLSPGGKGVGAVCCIDYTKDWDGMNRKAYQEKKEMVAEIFTGKLESLMPGFAQAVEYCEVGTSKTVEKYTLNPGGAVYGFAQTPERMGLKELSSIKNLHYASAWTRTGGGFSGAIMSGYMCAFNILRQRG